MTTIHKLIPPIHIHPILIIFMIIAYLTGTFVELFIILAIVLLHELGHYSAATIFRWRIRKVMLWIFGGVMDTDEFGSRPLKEEIIVTIAGPFQHVIIYGALYLVGNFHIVNPSILEMVWFYNTTILVFNLLPIWPLDGGKLLFYLFSKKLSFQKAFHFTLMLSLFLCFTFVFAQLLFYPFTLSALLIMVFLFLENYSEWRRKHYIFIRFLLNRYKGQQKIKAVRPLTVPSQFTLMEVFSLFRQDFKHPIYVQMPNDNRIFIDEMDCLRSYFFERKYNKTMGEIASIHTS